jgi:hypothetical protein
MNRPGPKKYGNAAVAVLPLLDDLTGRHAVGAVGDDQVGDPLVVPVLDELDGRARGLADRLRVLGLSQLLGDDLADSAFWPRRYWRKVELRGRSETSSTSRMRRPFPDRVDRAGVDLDPLEGNARRPSWPARSPC